MCITKILLTTFPFRFSPILLLKLPNRRGFERQRFEQPFRFSFHALVPLFLVVAGWYAGTRIGRRVRVHAREIPDKRAGVPRLRRGFLSQKTRSSVRGRRRGPPPVFRFSSPLRGPVFFSRVFRAFYRPALAAIIAP